jgi:hypothetical protein
MKTLSNIETLSFRYRAFGRQQSYLAYSLDIMSDQQMNNITLIFTISFIFLNPFRSPYLDPPSHESLRIARQ